MDQNHVVLYLPTPKTSQIHLFTSATPKIVEICKVLEDLHIYTFSFLERFTNGEIVYFSNNREWLLDYFSKNLNETSQFDCEDSLYQTLDYALWPEDSSLEVYKYGRDVHDSDHGITITKQLSDSVRYFFFSTSKDFPEVKKVYAQHLNVLKRFAAFFEQEAAQKIVAAHALIDKPRRKKEGLPPDPKIQNFYAKTTITHKIALPGLHDNFVKLSPQEWHCLSLITRHLTAPEIAEKLNLSVRTIETHLNNLKNKLGCYRKTELLEIGLRFKYLF